MSDSQSLCDRCRNPARCCSGFALNSIDNNMTGLEALAYLAQVEHEDVNGETIIGLPFMPLWRAPPFKEKLADGTEALTWRFWCPLNIKGRCSIYEKRPLLCATYEPQSDFLCAMSTWESMHKANPEYFPDPRDESEEGKENLRLWREGYPWVNISEETDP